jgi:hypothetical protein
MTDPLVKLFGSAARTKLLRLFLFNPRQSWSIAEAATHAAVDVSVARSEIKLFQTIGLVKSAGRRGSSYTLNTNFEYTAALQSLLLNAPARAADLFDRLHSAGSLKLIITAGIFVGEWEGRADLFIVGDRINERKLRAKIRTLESELGKELRYAVLTTPDFLYRLNMNDKLVRDVFDYTHMIVHDRLNIGLK